MGDLPRLAQVRRSVRRARPGTTACRGGRRAPASRARTRAGAGVAVEVERVARRTGRRAARRRPPADPRRRVCPPGRPRAQQMAVSPSSSCWDTTVSGAAPARSPLASPRGLPRRVLRHPAADEAGHQARPSGAARLGTGRLRGRRCSCRCRRAWPSRVAPGRRRTTWSWPSGPTPPRSPGTSRATSTRIPKDGALWIAWPKKSSGIVTDITEDVVRREALEIGVVDVKVCAIDATWSGLKLVYRTRDR